MVMNSVDGVIYSSSGFARSFDSRSRSHSLSSTTSYTTSRSSSTRATSEGSIISIEHDAVRDLFEARPNVQAKKAATMGHSTTPSGSPPLSARSYCPPPGVITPQSIVWQHQLAGGSSKPRPRPLRRNSTLRADAPAFVPASAEAWPLQGFFPKGTVQGLTHRVFVFDVTNPPSWHPLLHEGIDAANKVVKWAAAEDTISAFESWHEEDMTFLVNQLYYAIYRKALALPEGGATNEIDDLVARAAEYTAYLDQIIAARMSSEALKAFRAILHHEALKAFGLASTPIASPDRLKFHAIGCAALADFVLYLLDCGFVSQELVGRCQAKLSSICQRST